MGGKQAGSTRAPLRPPAGSDQKSLLGVVALRLHNLAAADRELDRRRPRGLAAVALQLGLPVEDGAVVRGAVVVEEADEPLAGALVARVALHGLPPAAAAGGGHDGGLGDLARLAGDDLPLHGLAPGLRPDGAIDQVGRVRGLVEEIAAAGLEVGAALLAHGQDAHVGPREVGPRGDGPLAGGQGLVLGRARPELAAPAPLPRALGVFPSELEAVLSLWAVREAFKGIAIPDEVAGQLWTEAGEGQAHLAAAREVERWSSCRRHAEHQRVREGLDHCA
mmetsp:Transcript_37263/g.115989  ORF Transcript_37263/g.115989 Transcript_37263/m.115989 type:complete len:278 (-) Transcript_37263:79-912(-)